ncbi:hypothetical protein EDD21DRAFT_361715 [Dissophora ornata]|nr:hypothetical protein BGZ58_008413 [Dissophora ornata]KAI8606185.1 hypothetical protein EDD21DRAFT_361715 [Dissophora ornata]
MNPLNLSEIRSRVSLFLTRADLYSCILVCHDWSPDFLPRLYNPFYLDYETHRRVPYASLCRNQQYIRNLTYPHTAIFDRADWIGLPPCSNLHHLDIRLDCTFRITMNLNPARFSSMIHADPRSSLQYDEDEDPLNLSLTDRFMDLIRLSSGLHTLKENWAAMTLYHTSRFAKQLVQHQNEIVVMNLSSWQCSYDRVATLLKNSPKLEELRLEKFDVREDYDDSNEGSEQPGVVLLDLGNIRLLRLDKTAFRAGKKQLVRIIGRDLLEIEMIGSKTGLDTPILSWECPQLRTLKVTDGRGTDIVDLDGHHAIGHQALESVLLVNCWIQPGFQAAVCRHLAGTLRNFDMRTSTGLSILGLD